MSRRAQHGSIALPDLGSVPALVQLDAAYATAVLLVRPLRSLEDVVGSRVGVDLTTARGLLHVEARVAGLRDGEVLDLEVAGGREVVQRRAFARVDAVLEIGVAPGIAASAVNISGSGALVSCLEGLSTGDVVDLSLRLAPHEPPIAIGGRIVRECDGHLRAVHFERVAEADRERIVQFVFERQRLELQRMKRA